MEPTKCGPILAVFASNKGPGDAERASLMSQTGTYFAKRGAQLVCLAENGIIPIPLITAARAAGGVVQIVVDTSIILPPALAGVTMDVLDDQKARFDRVAELAEGLVTLPGSLGSAVELFGVWSAGKNRGRNCPVVMLNRHKAFEVLRGYAVDVLSPGLPGYDKAIQFADTVEDLWSRISWLVSEVR
ncbi:MAG: LOG family protein [Candidatus Devosia symbiotica]|nr:LOG family protein [Candidatus Devosia symbiotica]